MLEAAIVLRWDPRQRCNTPDQVLLRLAVMQPRRQPLPPKAFSLVSMRVWGSKVKLAASSLAPGLDPVSAVRVQPPASQTFSLASELETTFLATLLSTSLWEIALPMT
jgi:hypothetical protein